MLLQKRADQAGGVAAQHQRSAMIEKHYSKYITEHSIDDITRAGAVVRSLRPPPTTSSRWCGDAGDVSVTVRVLIAFAAISAPEIVTRNLPDNAMVTLCCNSKARAGPQ